MHTSFLIKGGVLISGVIFYTILYVAGWTMHTSFLIKGGVLISEAVSFIFSGVGTMHMVIVSKYL